MAITNYDKYLPEAQSKGKLANYQDYSAETKAAAEDVSFGVALQLSSDGEKVSEFSGGTPAGVALAQEVKDWQNPNADDQKYRQNTPVAVVRKGVIWVEVLEDVIPGDKVKVDNASGNFLPSSTEVVESTDFPSAEFRSSAVAGELAQLEINLP